MKIEINLKLILVLILFFMIKNLNTYLIFMIFIIIHELAHLLVGIVFGGIPEKIAISPFGLSLEFYSYGNSKSLCKIIFYVIGPLTNLLIAIIFLKFLNNNYTNQLIILTNMAIGIFNLIPILPLDGGKILRETLKNIVGIEKANKFTIYFSKFILIIISLLYSILILKLKNIMILLLLIYLWYLYSIEEKKYTIYKKTSECIKNII